ncbi:hypothetical protein D3C85_1309750 [compost metagenome]
MVAMASMRGFFSASGSRFCAMNTGCMPSPSARSASRMISTSMPEACCGITYGSSDSPKATFSTCAAANVGDRLNSTAGSRR